MVQIKEVYNSIKECLKKRSFKLFLFSLLFIAILNAFCVCYKNPFLNQCCLLAEGIFSIVLLFAMIAYSVKEAHLRLSKTDFIAIAGIIICSFVVYIIVVSLRTSIYTWDHTTYFERMRYLTNKYSSSPIEGLRAWLFSGMQNDYGCFLTMFIYPLFFFTNGSIQSFIFSYFFTCTVPTMIALYCFAKWAFFKVTDIKKDTIVSISIAVIISLLPLLHSASIKGMPDVFGLTFAIIILLLTLPYDFSRKDYKKWIIIFLATISIVLTRRWYWFFVIGYYCSYFIVLIIDTAISKNKQKIGIHKNIALFGVSCSVLGIIILNKMINMILNKNYSDSYSSWNTGGFFAEIPNQIQMLGIIVFVVVLFGWIIGIINSKTRYYTIVLLISNIISLFAFTRIQNMGHHQSLILFPCYFWGIMLSLSFLYLQKQKILCIIPVIAVAFSAVNCLCINTSNTVTDIVFSKLDLYPHQRLDTKGLDEINIFFDNTLKSDEKVLVLAASIEYDSEVFTHYPQPFSNLYYYTNNFLAPSGGFPEGFFDAQYLLVINPIQERDNVKNEHVLQTIITEFNQNSSVNSHFDKVKTIQMQNGIEAIIYKRIVSADNDEISVFINAFSDYCNRYPELFYDRLVKHLQ